MGQLVLSRTHEGNAGLCYCKWRGGLQNDVQIMITPMYNHIQNTPARVLSKHLLTELRMKSNIRMVSQPLQGDKQK